MKIAVVSWSDVKGEASVGFTPEFEKAHHVLKLDAIQDAMHALQEKYDAVYNDAKKELV